MNRTLAAHQSTCWERRRYKLCSRFYCWLSPPSSPQITVRFKESVGGRSYGLSLSFCLLLPPHWCVWLLERAQLVLSPLLAIHPPLSHSSYKYTAIKHANVCQSKHKPSTCQHLALSVRPFEPTNLHLSGDMLSLQQRQPINTSAADTWCITNKMITKWTEVCLTLKQVVLKLYWGGPP